MEISSSKEAGAVIVTVKGRMDAVTSTAFDEELGTLTDQGEKVIILDFSGLDYISSAGLRSILSASKKSKGKNGRILLTSLRDVVKEVFDISGFSAILPIYETLDEALSHA